MNLEGGGERRGDNKVPTSPCVTRHDLSPVLNVMIESTTTLVTEVFLKQSQSTVLNVMI